MRNDRSMVNLKRISVVHLNVDSGYITYLARTESGERTIVKGVSLTR
jgi:hypothetical protein